MLVAALVLLVRKTDSFTNPQFWAEDFWPFFVDANIFGPRVLIAPYNGYLHLLPRVIAWMAAPLDPLFQPTAYLAGAVVVTLLVVGNALSLRLDLPGKPWMALAIVAVPHTGEVFLNPTNLQWVTALGLLITLLKRDPAGAGEWAADVAMLIIAGLSGPFSVLLLPLFAVRALTKRTAASLMLMGVMAVAAAVQGWFLWHASPLPDLGVWHWANLAGVMAVRLPMTLAMGETWPVRLGYAWTITLGFLLATAFVLLSCRLGRWRESRLLLIGALGLLLVSAIKRSRPDTWAFSDTFNGDRYFYTPKVVAVWLAGIAISELHAGWQRRIGMLCVGFAFTANLPAFRIKPVPDLHWALYCGKIRAGEQVEIPTNPGWHRIYPGRSNP